MFADDIPEATPIFDMLSAIKEEEACFRTIVAKYRGRFKRLAEEGWKWAESQGETYSARA